MPQIRDAVLGSCRPHYCKVAMVIVRASKQLGADDEEALKAIAGEIEKLVNEGLLQAVGDLSLWRRSEVRLSSE